MITDLEKALDVAVSSFAGQKDKSGNPAILHTLRVVTGCTGEKEQIVAALHDVLEDTEYPEAMVRLKFGDEIADAVVAITHQDNEDYEEYLRKVAANPLALAVKIIDMKDNTGRLFHLKTSEFIRIALKYHEGMKILGI